MGKPELIELAERDFGAIKHRLPIYWFGAVCWAIVMLWPFRWFHRLPNAILAWAGCYAHDARQYAKGLSSHDQ